MRAGTPAQLPPESGGLAALGGTDAAVSVAARAASTNALVRPAADAVAAGGPPVCGGPYGGGRRCAAAPAGGAAAGSVPLARSVADHSLTAHIRHSPSSISARGGRVARAAPPARPAAADLVDAGLLANEWDRATAHESPSDTTSGATRRRHAAELTVSVIATREDPGGRRLMGESTWPPAPQSVAWLLRSEAPNPHVLCRWAQGSRMEATNAP